MKTKKLFNLFLVALLISSTSIQAQKSPDYLYQFDGEVKWMMLLESGTLIASTGEALVGIRPNSGELSFKFPELKKIKEENLEVVAGTPYLIIKPKGLMNQNIPKLKLSCLLFMMMTNTFSMLLKPEQMDIY